MQLNRKEDQPEAIRSSGGEIVHEILGIRAGGGKSHSVAKITLPPGGASLRHFHKHSEESYLIHTGTAHLTLDQKTYELLPGDAVLIEPYEVHQIANRGEEDLIFTAVCVPPWHPGDSFNQDDSESA